MLISSPTVCAQLYLLLSQTGSPLGKGLQQRIKLLQRQAKQAGERRGNRQQTGEREECPSRFRRLSDTPPTSARTSIASLELRDRNSIAPSYTRERERERIPESLSGRKGIGMSRCRATATGLSLSPPHAHLRSTRSPMQSGFFAFLPTSPSSLSLLTGAVSSLDLAV